MSVNRDIEKEIRFHFEARIAELGAQGKTRDEAQAVALAEFGDVTAVREKLREIDHRVARRRGRLEWMDGVRQDVVYAARSLWRTPAVSLTIILTLALGLGANAAMFSLLDVIFLRPPAGVAAPSALRRVWEQRTFSSGVQFWSGFDYPKFAVLSQATSQQADATWYKGPELNKLTDGENAPKAALTWAAASYFPLLGIKPQLGRVYLADEDRFGSASPVAVISDAFWKRQFGGTSDVLNRDLPIGTRHYTVIGVLPPQFTGTELNTTDVWLPVAGYRRSNGSGKPWWTDPNVNGFQVILRLHSGANEQELTQRASIALRGPNLGYQQDTLAIASFGSIVAANGPGKIKPEVTVATRLAGVAVIVLLIACANVINLLLARAIMRRREIAVRLALGVSRARLIRLLVTESVMLAGVAGAAAIVAAMWGGSLLRVLLIPEVQFAGPPLHWRVLAFALAAALAAGTVAGLIPALQMASPDLTSALRAGSHSSGGHRSRLRSTLVAVQAALSIVLLVGAVLFVRSLENVKAHDIGFAVDRLLYADLDYDRSDSVRESIRPQRLRALEPRIAAIRGVERVAFTSMRPYTNFGSESFFAEADTVGRNVPKGAIGSAVSPEYFAVTGGRLLQGRGFAAVTAKQPLTVILNEALAKAIWPNGDAVGHCMHFSSADAPCATVIGVAQNEIFSTIGEKPEPLFYVPLDHSPVPRWNAEYIIVRASPASIPNIQNTLDGILRQEFPGSVPRLKTMAALMEPVYRPWRLGATLFTLFGVLALVVASIGIYSSVSYAVTQRTHEFGIRVALGARTADVLRQVLGDGLRIVAIGVMSGIVLALAAGRLVASLLYGISPSDPLAMVIVAVTLLTVATLAALIPAWRAAKADPVTALRAD